jgi:hypothetical protein
MRWVAAQVKYLRESYLAFYCTFFSPDDRLQAFMGIKAGCEISHGGSAK